MSEILHNARAVLAIESEAIARLADRLDERFTRAVELILACRGRVVVTGIGKSGAIGRKLASTFASTGTPALFLHAAEGLHGDLGMCAPGDVLLAISYTGRTDELTGILPVVRDMKIPIIALTGNSQAYLAAHADVVLDISVEKEACPLNLAPTSSTAAALAMGDALAVCAMQERGFAHDDFARFHPGGTLGKTSKLRVGELMRTGARLALVEETATVRDALHAITQAQSGSAVVTQVRPDSGAHREAEGRILSVSLCGYFTDGDSRRRLLQCEDASAFLGGCVSEIMTRAPLSFSPETLAIEALRALQERGVDDAPVVDENNVPVGILDVQELLRAGLV